jgi:hypothetical protein
MHFTHLLLDHKGEWLKGCLVMRFVTEWLVLTKSTAAPEVLLISQFRVLECIRPHRSTHRDRVACSLGGLHDLRLTHVPGDFVDFERAPILQDFKVREGSK